MRHLATMPEESARRLADYLLTQQIQTQLTPEGDGTAVWVRDEDRLPQAREELAAFNRNPADPRYQAAAPLADSLRRREAAREEDYRVRQARFQASMRGLTLGRCPVTTALIGIAVVLTLASNFGSPANPVAQACYIASFKITPLGSGRQVIAWDYLGDIRSGQVWRLLTPIFLHMGVMHLLFDLMMLWWLGSAMESSRGWWRFALFIVAVGVASNLIQYYLGGMEYLNGELSLHPSPLFGGMSGVVYGIFGYVWMKSWLQPELGLTMPSETVLILMGWFVLCLLGVLGPVANGAHAGGLALGILLGCVPGVWRGRRRQLDV